MFGNSRGVLYCHLLCFFKCFVRLCHCMTPTGGWWCIMWRQMSWEQKGPFLPKLEDGSGSSFFFPPSKKSKKTADTYRRGKYDLWWHHVLPKQICFEEDCFFFWCVVIKKQWIILEGVLVQILLPLLPPPHPHFSQFYDSLGVLILMLATEEGSKIIFSS